MRDDALIRSTDLETKDTVGHDSEEDDTLPAVTPT
jgi:hypothetical protein